MSDAAYLLAELQATESWHFWFQARRRLIVWTIARYFPEARRVLDIGCGTGFIVEGLRGRHPGVMLVGSDLQSEPLAMASRRLPEVRFVQASALSPPFEAAFDLILALDVIEHIDDDRAALTAMLGALRPGGGLIVTVPQHPSLWSQVDDFSHHRRRYTWRELDEKVRSAGLDVVRRTSFFMLTLPLLLISRRRAPAEFDPTAEFRLPRWINTVLNLCMEGENLAIRAGVTLPVGGSLLMIARRPL